VRATAPAFPGRYLAGGRVRLGIARRLVRDLSWVLIISGLLLLADTGITLIWQEPVTAAVALIERSQIDTHFLSYRSAPLSRVQLRSLRASGARSDRHALAR
jgi:hypothetical protein